MKAKNLTLILVFALLASIAACVDTTIVEPTPSADPATTKTAILPEPPAETTMEDPAGAVFEIPSDWLEPRPATTETPVLKNNKRGH